MRRIAMIRPATATLSRIGVQRLVAQTRRLGKNIRHGMRRLEIVGINYLPVIAELGELLLADFDLLVIFFDANRFVISHDAFVT